jgi:tripartite-type tricarboxylate transporter receptor subunit TctC
MIQRTLAAALLGAGLLASATAASAANDYPTKPITIVVPVAPGGTVDRVARIIGDGLSKQFGQSVIVENRAGAAGTIGTRHVASAAPDGYTLLAIANTFASVPEFMDNAGYDALKDFAPITQTCSIPMVLVTNTSVKPKTVKEFIDYAKAGSGPVTIGSSGLGSTGYIAAELFNRAAGIKMEHVYYKGNSAALADVLGGHVVGMFDQVSTAAPGVKSGKLHALGVTTLTRSSSLPDVPTLDEAGLKGFQDETFNALMAPAGTPAHVVAKLHAAVKQVMEAPEVQKQLSEGGIDVKVSASPEAFGTYMAESIQRYKEIATTAAKP